MYTNLLNEIIKKYNLEMSKLNEVENFSKPKLKYGISIENFHINESSRYLKKGEYSILTYPDFTFANFNQTQYFTKQLCQSLKNFLNNISSKSKILIVGLGNRNMVADSLGVQVVKNVMVTNHLKTLKQFPNLPFIYAFCPSVFGLTGLESSDLVKSVASKIKPDVVILIDTLCAASHVRLGTSFQINNSGIVPGAGIGNARKNINKNFIGAKVISIGVPLVVYAKTFLQDAIENLPSAIKKQVEQLNYNNLVVTVKDIEELLHKCAYVISGALNEVLTGYNLKQQEEFFKSLNNKY